MSTVDTIVQVRDQDTGEMVVRCFRGVRAIDLAADRFPGMQLTQSPKAVQSLTPATAVFCDSWKITNQDGDLFAWLFEVPRA